MNCKKASFWLTAVAISAPTLAWTAPRATIDHPCAFGERLISGSNSMPKAFAQDMDAFLSHRMKPVLGFSKGLTLRKIAQSPEVKTIAEYWIARSLYEAKLYHLAFEGFNVIASRELTEDTVGVQIAALGCLNEIQIKYPSLAFPGSIGARMDDYAKAAENRRPADQELVARATMSLLKTALDKKSTSNKLIDHIVSLFKKNSGYYTFANSLAQARRGNYQATIRDLEKFMAAPNHPKDLARYQDTAHMILARAYYSTGQFDQASAQLKLVKKSSNELANSLSELAWAFLMDDKLTEAIGTSINLRTGGLRHTFVPESPMVMAMALNELCQYPESVRAIYEFRKAYESPYRWLSHSRSQPAAGPNGEPAPSFYNLAINHLKKTNKAVPDRIATEWIRSSVFISNQDEINLLFDEKDFSKTLARSGSEEQNAIAFDILKTADELRPKVHEARAKLKPEQPLPGKLVAELVSLKRKIIDLKRLQQAAPFWRQILASSDQRAIGREKTLVAEVNEDIKLRNERMFAQLQEIAENVQLIEVEIYNGASQDIIWQNAHPDYQQVAQQMNKEAQISGAKVWDWGRAPAAQADEAEVWEDELGSFKADLFDNCSSKEKYLHLKARKVSS